RDVRVVPIVFEPSLFGTPEPRQDSDRPLVLSVGRLSPHKRHDLVIRAFALFQKDFAPDARLLCPGEPISQSYLDRLTALVSEVGAANVELPGPLAQERLTE